MRQDESKDSEVGDCEGNQTEETIKIWCVYDKEQGNVESFHPSYACAWDRLMREVDSRPACTEGAIGEFQATFSGEAYCVVTAEWDRYRSLLAAVGKRHEVPVRERLLQRVALSSGFSRRRIRTDMKALATRQRPRKRAPAHELDLPDIVVINDYECHRGERLSRMQALWPKWLRGTASIWSKARRGTTSGAWRSNSGAPAERPRFAGICRRGRRRKPGDHPGDAAGAPCAAGDCGIKGRGKRIEDRGYRDSKGRGGRDAALRLSPLALHSLPPLSHFPPQLEGRGLPIAHFCCIMWRSGVFVAKSLRTLSSLLLQGVGLMRRPFVAGNWKMNMDRASAVALAEGVAKHAAGVEGVEIAVCPPFVYLEAVGKVLAGSKVGLGAQNLFPEPKGAYTGEVSPVMLKDIGCQYVILGHSERRHILRETDAEINDKVFAALDNGLTPIVCVGELLAEREAGKTLRVIRRQFGGSLAGLTDEQMKKVVIAYEPVWAIGTGKTATPDQAEEVHADLRKILEDRYNKEVAGAVRIQYGGSMKPDNAAQLLSKPNIDGGLIGGAALVATQFLAIVTGVPSQKRA